MDKKETSNITVGYYHALDEKQITISLEEYKELLIIKGKYEELKDKCWKCYQQGTTITYRDSDGGLRLSIHSYMRKHNFILKLTDKR